MRTEHLLNSYTVCFLYLWFLYPQTMEDLLCYVILYKGIGHLQIFISLEVLNQSLTDIERPLYSCTQTCQYYTILLLFPFGLSECFCIMIHNCSVLKNVWLTFLPSSSLLCVLGAWLLWTASIGCVLTSGLELDLAEEQKFQTLEGKGRTVAYFLFTHF